MLSVMAGLVPAIHVSCAYETQDVDARHKAGHDEEPSKGCRMNDSMPAASRPASEPGFGIQMGVAFELVVQF
jgi:hypothetical protein